MKRVILISLALALCLSLTLPLAGCAKKPASDGSGRDYGPSDIFTIDLPEDGAGVSYGSPEQEPEQAPPAQDAGESAVQTQSGVPTQLTMEDIREMNGDSTVIDIYNNSGYLSTLVGKYYAQKVQDAEDGVKSVQGMASLLGLTRGCEFFVVYSEQDDDGYTYYTYQQRYGEHTLQYATMRIAVDPEGYTAGLTCSFVPNIGTAPQDPEISAQQAEQIVQQRAGAGLTILSGHDVRLAVPMYNVVYNCWVIYTNNPDLSPGFDMPYLAHYVTTEGEYVTSIPCNSFAESNRETMNNDAYFDGLQTQDVRFTISMPAGGTKQITLPISRNESDGKYYLMDPARKIAVAGYRSFYYQNKLDFVASGSQSSGWSENDLMAYYNYINAYDFYAARGIRSVDGFGIPILVTVGYCDENGNAVDNACYYGVNNGWACFAASDANKYSYCADVCGHEFTHGVTSNSMQGIYYQNETGAINEAYSDIMGNLCEKMTGETSDPGWLVAENSGSGQMRNMADPNQCNQPAYVGDRYYVAAVMNPNGVNDLGGVHGDNSLITHMAVLLEQAGMTLDEQFSMWSTSIELLTPASDYEDLHGILLLSLKINGMLQTYGAALNKAFRDIGLDEDWNTSYLDAVKPGCGRIRFQVDGSIAKLPCLAAFYGADGQFADAAYPDRNGIVSLLLPAGSYAAVVQYLPEGKNDATVLRYTGSRWSTGGDPAWFSVTSGGTVNLGTLGGDTGSVVSSPAEGSALNLVQFNGGYFTMLVPEGWRIEVCGEYGSMGVKLFDPYEPSRQVFLYGALAPFHKSEASRRYMSYYDTTGGMISNGPVLTSPTVRGITDCWSSCIEYQKRYGKQLFSELYDINMLLVTTYDGPYAAYGQETVGLGTCTDTFGTQCALALATSLVDMDFYGYYGGNWYYTAYGTMGVLCPVDEFDLYYPDLLLCAQSLQFSEDYIRASQSSSTPLNDNPTTASNLALIANAITALCAELP